MDFLRVVHPPSARILMGVLWLGSIAFVALLLRSEAPVAVTGLACAAVLSLGWIFRMTVLPVCEIDAEGITNRTWTGQRRYRREDLLGCEEIGCSPQSLPNVLIRFRTGVVVLSQDRAVANPGETLRHLTRLWNLKLADFRRQPAGPVEPGLTMGYERFHAYLLGGLAALLALVAIASPLLWACIVVAAYCARACYYCSCRVSTSPAGIILHRPWRPDVSIGWDEAFSVRYWHSAVQGGVSIAAADGRQIRIYRWIADYPRFNRLLRDRLAPGCFPPAGALPLRIHMNRRRRTMLVPLAVLAGAGLVFAVNGSWVAALAATFLPASAIVVLLAGSGRTIEIDNETACDTYRVLWHKTTAVYRRSDLEDMRLGRQLTAGGLWIRFGQVRLEIANADAEYPPEEVLACLRQSWQCEAQVERGAEWVLEEAA